MSCKCRLIRAHSSVRIVLVLLLLLVTMVVILVNAKRFRISAMMASCAVAMHIQSDGRTAQV